MNKPSPDFILHPSPSPSPYHIFFLPGNPGLVQFYAGFLSLLHEGLNSSHETQNSPSFNVAGCSFAGFEIGDDRTPEREKLYSITEQVDFSLARLRTYIQNCNKNSSPNVDSGHDHAPEERKAKVILIGHSFGTFVATEMLKRISNSTENDDFEIIGSILLFPPIPDLAKSPQGAKLSVLLPLLLPLSIILNNVNFVQSIGKWKYLPGVGSSFAKLVCMLPLSWSSAAIRHVTGQPAFAVDTTQRFFGSRTGVAQALSVPLSSYTYMIY
jgi:Lipid-droplet associated hydrolase